MVYGSVHPNGVMVPVADEKLFAELAGVQCAFGAVAGSGVKKMETSRISKSLLGQRLRPTLSVGSLSLWQHSWRRRALRARRRG